MESEAAAAKRAEAEASNPPAYDGGQQPGYPPQQPGYPPQQAGYPPQRLGYPPSQPLANAGYPPQAPGYPPQGPTGGAPPTYDTAVSSASEKLPAYGTAQDEKPPQYHENMATSAAVEGDLVWGLEPSSEELEADSTAGKGKGIFQVITGTNTVRCAACGINSVWKDNAVKFVKCGNCRVITPRGGEKPLESGMDFVHCDGQCGHQLLVVPSGTKAFMCPFERKACKPFKR